MKRLILALLLLVISTNSTLAASSPEEPKDSFVLFSWRLYYEATTVVHSPSKETKPRAVVPQQIVTWYRAKASQYGGSDGFYYNHFACGGVYYPSVKGVAHKSLPCGTKVTFKYYGVKRINGKLVKGWYYSTMRVIDRGPYCCGRSFDFTVAAARSLGFNGIGTVYWHITK